LELALFLAVFRFGKPIEDLNSFLKALSIPDPVLRSLTAFRHLLLAGWLSMDAVQWVSGQISPP